MTPKMGGQMLFFGRDCILLS